MTASIPIAAITEKLRRLLERELGDRLAGIKVTVRPPDKAREAGTGRQVNIYLFSISEDPGLRNARLGTLVGPPPLALTLHYLVTAYGEDESGSETDSYAVLDAALAVLHGGVRIPLAGSEFDNMGRYVSVARVGMPTDELCRLWTAFQTPYRLSLVYELAVISGGVAS